MVPRPLPHPESGSRTSAALPPRPIEAIDRCAERDGPAVRSGALDRVELDRAAVVDGSADDAPGAEPHEPVNV